MLPISILDEKFTLQNIRNYALSVQLYPDRFDCAVIDKSQNNILALESHTLRNSFLYFNEIQNIKQAVPILEAHFHETILSIFSDCFTLIPAPIYDENDNLKYLQLVSQVNTEHIIQTDYIKILDAYMVYNLPAELNALLQNIFQFKQLKHVGSRWIETFLLNNKFQKGRQLAINAKTNQFEVMLSEGNKLILYNSFRYQTKEDFAYFVLNIYEQFQLNPHEQPLVVIGEIDKNSEIIELLSNYINEIQFVKRNTLFNYSYKLSAIAEHYYFNLFNQYLCE